MKLLKSCLLIVILVGLTFAQGYQKPAKVIQDVIDAPEIPLTSISPSKDKILLLQPLRNPPIADLSEPMLRLAGLRINPKTNGRHRQFYSVELALRDLDGGNPKSINFPKGAKLINPRWSADGKFIAVGNITPNGIELWVVDTETADAKKIDGVKVNTILGGFSWLPDQRSLVVNLVPNDRGAAPVVSSVPSSPSIQESIGKEAAIRTYQDMLTSPSDEQQFEYYTTSQPAIVTIDGNISTFGKPAIYDELNFSPDGKYVLTARVERPFSYLFPYSYFPHKVEVWDRTGNLVYKVADIPLQDKLPVGGVPTGRRSVRWIPTESSTLMWVEALDGGNPKNKVEKRDRLMTFRVPTRMAPRPLLELENRYSGNIFGANGGKMLVYDYDREKQRRRLILANYQNPREQKIVSDTNIRDRYSDIGRPVTQQLPNGEVVAAMDGDALFLTGRGSSPEGDRPFLRKMDLNTLAQSELFRSGKDSYETFVTLLDSNGESFVTRRESEMNPPNLFLNSGAQKGASAKQITDFKDPSPQLRKIQKKLVKYKRADGVDLSFTLYLPPDYKEGDKLPALLWAYPREYTNSQVAGQVSGSTNRFTQIGGSSHLFLVLQGYAVLNNATVPIVGDPKTVNDTFIAQLVAGSKAAIDKGAEMGVIDPNRVAVGGHSYGAFMTANLLAHSRLFKAGIARSGAYNRTLTPFGFQSERRSFWEATDIYMRLSPFTYANKIKDPILLIHGEADNNSGTYPIQSERLYSAVKGNGGTVRLVMLPAESHGYSAKESIGHVLWEQSQWMDRWVKNAKPQD